MCRVCKLAPARPLFGLAGRRSRTSCRKFFDSVNAFFGLAADKGCRISVMFQACFACFDRGWSASASQNSSLGAL